jgi:erythromycin esterase
MRHLVLSLLFTAAAGAQPYLNLDFETSTRGRARNWSLGGAGYELTLDSATIQSGRQSLRIRFQTQVGTSLGVASQLLPVDLARGRQVRFSGWIKHDSVARNNAGLWFRVDTSTGAVLSIDNAPPPGVGAPRTRDWTRYTIDREVSPNAAQIVFGAFHSGDGTAWFDNFEIEIDGVPLTQPPAPVIGEPATEQLDWIRQNAIPLTTPDAISSRCAG